MYRAMQLIENPNQLKVHFIDVDQGDSILIQAPNGKPMLIDGGVRSAGNTIVTYIQSLSIKKLVYVVATHPDADHIGGLMAVLNTIPIGEFVNKKATVVCTVSMGYLAKSLKRPVGTEITPSYGDEPNF